MSKREYVKPELNEYGCVAKLTKGDEGGGSDGLFESGP